MRWAYVFAVVAPLCCSRHAPPASVPLVARVTDSVVLERTRCFGTCPAYRVRVSRTGEVLFASQYPVADRPTVDTVQSWVVDSIVSDAARLGFFDLPSDIRAGTRPLCESAATDLPTITIGVFGSDTKRVVYYTGCMLPPKDHPMAKLLPGMKALADRIDELTRARKYIKPGA